MTHWVDSTQQVKMRWARLYDAGPSPSYPMVMSEMKDFPAEYVQFLEGLDEHHTAMVLPVMQESVAEGKYGVHIRGLGGHSEQALVDEKVPFGKVKTTVV